jgi:hypothetical protein
MAQQKSTSRIKDILLIVLIVGTLVFAGFVFVVGQMLSLK